MSHAKCLNANKFPLCEILMLTKGIILVINGRAYGLGLLQIEEVTQDTIRGFSFSTSKLNKLLEDTKRKR